MADFPQAVESVQALFREHAEEGEEEMGWLLSSERSREAQQVAPCAARLVQGEMDATGRLRRRAGSERRPARVASLAGGKARIQARKERAGRWPAARKS